MDLLVMLVIDRLRSRLTEISITKIDKSSTQKVLQLYEKLPRYEKFAKIDKRLANTVCNIAYVLYLSISIDF